MKPSKIERKKKEKLLKDITEILEDKGWKVLVIGGIRIEQRNPALKYNFEFVVGFTGRKEKSGNKV